MKLLRSSAFLALAALPFAVQAADLGLAKNFNDFIFGYYKGGSESEGAVAVGGNYYGSSQFAQHVHGQAPSGQLGTVSNIGLYVGGTLGLDKNGMAASATAHGNGIQNANAEGYVATKTATAVQENGTFHSALDLPTQFASMATSFLATKNNLIGQSSAINSLDNGSGVINIGGLDYSDQNHTKLNGVDLGTRNNLTFPVQSFAKKGVFDGVNVYVMDITPTGLSLLSQYNPILQFNGLDATHTLLLNFTGFTGANSALTFSPQIQTNSSNAYTLFNFADATSLTTGPQFTGSILAPKATVYQGGSNIQGNLIAKNFEQNAELHYDAGQGTFKGWVPAPQAVPEPSAWAALGLGAVAILRRRRR